MKTGVTAPQVIATIGVLVALLLSCGRVEAQTPAKVARIAVLSLASGPSPNMDIFRGLRELGWIEGRNITSEYR